MSVAALALAAAAAPQAHAQTVDFDGDVITFGDSLSDAGNVATLSGTGNVGAPFGTSNRFVNPGGLVWIEQVLGGVPETDGSNATSPQAVFFDELLATGTPTVVGDVNLAVGGAFAGSGNLGSPMLPGVQEQIDNFAAAGGMIDPTDTVTYWAGANNFFAGLPSVTGLGDAIDLGVDVGTLAIGDLTEITSGATIPGGGPGQVVVVNLPDLSLTPFLNTADFATRSAATAATDAYNATLEAGLAGLSDTFTNVDFVLLDVDAVFRVVSPNPAAFGFTNTTDACLLDADCAIASFEEQNQFLFADPVHPTNGGYALVAELARQTLDPADPGADSIGLHDVAILTRLFAVDQSLDRARSFFSSDAPQAGGAAFADPSADRGAVIFEGVGGAGGIDARGIASEIDYAFYGARFAFDYFQSENLVLGLQVLATEADADTEMTEFQTEQIGVDLYAGLKFQNVFGSFSFGGAALDVSDIERSVGVGPLVNTGETDGKQLSIGAELGYTAALGHGLQLIPTIGLGYVNTEIAGYSEEGVFAPLTFGDQDVGVLNGAVAVRAVKNFRTADGWRGRLSAGVGYEDFVSYSADDVDVNAQASTAAPVALAIADADGRGFVFDAGAKVALTESFIVSADYEFNTAGGETIGHAGAFRLISKF
ncbi:MAG: autotransporter domain-containing protein [Pseudomonadota bacterium]